MEKLLKVLTDPVSNRILQMIRVHKGMTISDILSKNTNVSRATVYRKVDKMLDVGGIEIVDTRKLRGQTENVYGIKEIYIANPETNEDCRKMVTISLMQMLDQYDRYFQSENADVNRDKLFLLNYAILLSDSAWRSGRLCFGIMSCFADRLGGKLHRCKLGPTKCLQNIFCQ